MQQAVGGVAGGPHGDEDDDATRESKEQEKIVEEQETKSAVLFLAAGPPERLFFLSSPSTSFQFPHFSFAVEQQQQQQQHGIRRRSRWRRAQSIARHAQVLGCDDVASEKPGWGCCCFQSDHGVADRVHCVPPIPGGRKNAELVGLCMCYCNIVDDG